MNNTLKKGLLYAVIAAGISGISIFYNKLVIVKGIDPLIFNILKNGGVALILSAFLLLRGKLSVLLRLSAKQWSKLVLIAVIGGSIPFVLYFDALKSVSAVNANILQKTMFIWVAMMAIPFLKEKLNTVQVVGYTLVAWSNLFIGGFTGFHWSTPELMIVGATILWSVENIIARKTMQDIDSTVTAWARMFFGGIILISIAVIEGKVSLLSTITPNQLLAVSGSIILLTAYVSSWYKSLSLAPATWVTATLILATPITNILSAIFITHTFPVTQIINAAVTVTGLLLITILAKIFSKKKETVSPSQI